MRPGGRALRPQEHEPGEEAGLGFLGDRHGDAAVAGDVAFTGTPNQRGPVKCSNADDRGQASGYTLPM